MEGGGRERETIERFTCCIQQQLADDHTDYTETYLCPYKDTTYMYAVQEYSSEPFRICVDTNIITTPEAAK